MKDNKLIAEFMGLSIKVDNGVWHNRGEYKDPQYQLVKYHSSWDWLMLVIQKILDLDVVTEDMELFYVIRDGIPDIESTYNRVVEFIKWYNE